MRARYLLAVPLLAAALSGCGLNPKPKPPETPTPTPTPAATPAPSTPSGGALGGSPGGCVQVAACPDGMESLGASNDCGLCCAKPKPPEPPAPPTVEGDGQDPFLCVGPRGGGQ